jgi:tellurite methyltransferase
MAADIGAQQPEDGGADETEEPDADGGEQRLGQNAIIDDLPSPFVAGWLARAAARVEAGGRSLDLAMGRGRHARLLARSGFRTFGVDVKIDAVRDAVARAKADSLVVRGWCADLTAAPLPRSFFDIVVVTRYLQRDLFPSIRDTLKTHGVVMYETFTTHQRRLGFGPASADHLLEPGELRQRFDGFEVLFYEEVEQPEAVARIVAVR